jgi:hypothetical protein
MCLKPQCCRLVQTAKAVGVAVAAVIVLSHAMHAIRCIRSELEITREVLHLHGFVLGVLYLTSAFWPTPRCFAKADALLMLA